MSGIVTEVHSSVKNFKVGDEVYGYVGSLGSNGTYCEYIVVPEIIVALKPTNLNFNQAAAIPLVGLTALQAVERCSVHNTDTIFITGGAGGVGSMVIRLLLHKGCSKIFTTAGNAESKEKIISFGLPEQNIINYKHENVIEKLLALSNNKIDVCIDTVGNEMSDLCGKIIKVNGTYADITFLTTKSARELFFNKGVIIINISNYAYALEEDKGKLAYYSEKLSLLTSYIKHKLMPETPIKVVGKLLVSTVAKAHSMLENNETKGQKLIMEMD